MKILLISIVFQIMIGSLVSSPIDISDERIDFRRAILSKNFMERAVKEKSVFVDSTRLTRSELMKQKFGESVFGVHPQKWSDKSSLSHVMSKYLEENEGSLGTFFKSGSTTVKVFQRSRIHLFVAHEAMRSELQLEIGDVVVLQALGDLL